LNAFFWTAVAANYVVILHGCGTTVDLKCSVGVKEYANRLATPNGELYCGVETKYRLVTVGGDNTPHHAKTWCRCVRSSDHTDFELERCDWYYGRHDYGRDCK
jgi:hypothetical protein